MPQSTLGFGLRPKPENDPERIARLRTYLVTKGINPDMETAEKAKAVEEFTLAERDREQLEASLDPSKAFIAHEERNRQFRKAGMPEIGPALDQLTGYQSITDLAKGNVPDLPVVSKEEIQRTVVAGEEADKFYRKGGTVPAPFTKSAYFPGQGPVVLWEKGSPIPLESLHPTEAYEAGYIEQPNAWQIAAWEKRHRAERMERAGMGGVAGGFGNVVRGMQYAAELGGDIAGPVGRVVGIPHAEKPYGVISEVLKTGADSLQGVKENTQRFMWGTGVDEQTSIFGGSHLPSIGGKVISGVSEILAMGPMFRALGKYALPIYEGIRGFGESNPDTEIYVPGVGNVKGRFLPTVIGAAHGAVLQSVLHWAEGTPGLAGRVKGAAAFGLPDVIAQIATKQGIDPEEVAASLAMGGIMTHGVPTGKMWRDMVVKKTGDLFKAGPGDVTLQTLNEMNAQGRNTTAFVGLGGKDFEWLRGDRDDKVPIGNLEPGRGQGKSSMDITTERIDAMEKVIDVLDSRVPAGGKPIGPKVETTDKNPMFQRVDEEGNPISGTSKYAFMGTGLRELDWLKNKRQDVKFARYNAATVKDIPTIERALTELNGGKPLETEGSALRPNADLYVFSFDVDQMCPRSQGQRNTQNLIEQVTGFKLTPDHVADLREYMKGLGEAVACPQCYTESHRIAADFIAVKERPLGAYNKGDLQKLLSTPRGQKMKSWLDIHTGFRMNANTDYKPQFLPQILRAVTDAAEMGMHGNGYFKRFEGVDILVLSRMRMSLSIGSDIKNGRLVENLDIGVPWEPAFARRQKYDNVGTVNIVKTIDEFWASMEHPQIDRIIGLHHSNIPVRIRERWGALADFTTVQSDHWKPGITDAQKAAAKKEYERYCESIGVKPLYVGKKGDEHPVIGDWMHEGNIEIFFELADRFGLKPRFTGSKSTPDFSEGGTNPNYMKAVGPECGQFGDNTREPMKAEFNWKAIRNSLNNFARYGGLDLESWYSTSGAEYMVNKLRPDLKWRAPEPGSTVLGMGLGGRDIEAIKKSLAAPVDEKTVTDIKTSESRVWEPRTPEERALADKAAAGQTTLGPHRAAQAWTRTEGAEGFDDIALRYGTIEDIARNQNRPLPEEVDLGTSEAKRPDKYRPPVSMEEYQSVRDEMRRRIDAGEPRAQVAKDLRARGYNVKILAWGGIHLLREPTPAQRKAAGEPTGAPENPGKYPLGKSFIKSTSSATKSPLLTRQDKTVWDIMRRLSAGTEGSYNLLRDQGLPKPEDTHAREANAWERAAFWADEKGNLMTNIRDVLKEVAEGPLPLWVQKGMENSPTQETTPKELQDMAKYLLSLEHVDGPVRWGKDKKAGNVGSYEPDTGMILLDPTHRLSPQTAVHEAAHGAMMRFRARLSPENWEQLRSIWQRTRNLASTELYGHTDVREYGAEALSNQFFNKTNELAGNIRAAESDVARGAGQKYHGLEGEALKDYADAYRNIGPEGVAKSKAIAEQSRAGLTKESPALPEAVGVTRIDLSSGDGRAYRIDLPGGTPLFNRWVDSIKPGETEADVVNRVREEVGKKWIEGSYLMGLGGKDIEAIKRALEGAPGITKQDEAKAVEFFKKMEAMPKPKAPEATGVPLKSERVVIPYGTAERATLEKAGVKFTGEVGKPQKFLDEYDTHAATLNKIRDAEPFLVKEMDKPLPDRPSNMAEVFPEASIVKGLRDVAVAAKGKGKQGWFETGLRFFERAGGGPMNVLKEVFYTPMKRGADEVEKSGALMAERMRAVAKHVGLTMKFKDSLELGKWLVARQHGGEKTLELSGMDELTAQGYKTGTPPAPIKRMMNWMDSQLLKAFHEVNKERIRSGQEPIEWRQDYFTFWHIADALNRNGVNLYSTPKEAVDEAIATWQRNYDNDLSTKQAEFRSKSRFSKWMFQKRSGNLGPVDLDAYGVFTRYMHSAYEQMYLSQAQSVMKKLVDGSWDIDGERFKLSEVNKPMADSLSNYMGFLSTGVKPGEIPKEWFDVFQKLGRNVAVGKVGANFKSSLNQLTSNVHSWSQLGTKYWAQGFMDYLKAQADGISRGHVEGGKWGEAKEAGDIKSRRREQAFAEFLMMRPRTALGRGKQKLGEWGMKPLQDLDMVTAEITWRGAYQKAMDGNAEGMMGVKGNHERAVDYANQEVVRTQGSTHKADITPFQRGQWGKTLGVLQNFVINEWGFVTRDVMGIKNADKGNPEHVKRAVRFVVGALFIDWLYEDVLKIRSPFNVLANPLQTIRPAVAEYKKSGDVLKAAGAGALGAASTLPLVGRGFTPYGAGGGLGAGLETLQKGGELVRKPTAEGAIDWAGSLAGVPGSYAASRYMKLRKQGASVPAAVAGTKPPEKDTTKNKVYDPETGTWKEPAKSGGKKGVKNKTYNPETGEWQ